MGCAGSREKDVTKFVEVIDLKGCTAMDGFKAFTQVFFGFFALTLMAMPSIFFSETAIIPYGLMTFWNTAMTVQTEFFAHALGIQMALLVLAPFFGAPNSPYFKSMFLATMGFIAFFVYMIYGFDDLMVEWYCFLYVPIFALIATFALYYAKKSGVSEAGLLGSFKFFVPMVCSKAKRWEIFVQLYIGFFAATLLVYPSMFWADSALVPQGLMTFWPGSIAPTTMWFAKSQGCIMLILMLGPQLGVPSVTFLKLVAIGMFASAGLFSYIIYGFEDEIIEWYCKLYIPVFVLIAVGSLIAIKTAKTSFML